MTEDIQTQTSLSELNRNSEKHQLQVTDIIDQLANSAEICPYEITQTRPGSSFIQENPEGDRQLAENSAYEVLVGTRELQGKSEENNEENNDVFSQESRDWEEASKEGLCEKAPLSVREFQEEENDASNLEDVNASSPKEIDDEQGNLELNEFLEQIKEETQSEENESITEENLDDAEEGAQKDNRVDSHRKWQENSTNECLLTPPSYTSQTEKCDGQPAAAKKNDISRHSYSRYNTISYRKIRKGNTKQRIDEFESMMHS